MIDTITGRGVLILGRFHDERKAVLDALRERLRELGLVPMVFDWDKPTRRTVTQTVQLLANMSRFVIADVTDAKSIPQELGVIIPHLPSVPVRPIILEGEYEYSMFKDWKEYGSVLEVYRYQSKEQLVADVEAAILQPIEEWEAGFDEKKALRDQRDAAEARAREERKQRESLEAEVRALRAQLE